MKKREYYETKKLDKEEKFDYPRELEKFKYFLENRKEAISNDLKFISEKYNIKEEELENIKNKIRNILGNQNIKYISTTLHLRPRAIDYLNLGFKRIEQVIDDDEKIFNYPVYYQKYEQERPDFIYLGNFRFSLCDIIPFLKNKKFKTSLDFHLELMDYLSNEGWEKEISENLEILLNKELSNLKINLRGIFIEEAQKTVISILKDYYNSFKNINEKIQNITDINSQLADVLLDNYETLRNIIEDLGITKDYLDDLKNKMIKDITYEFIVLICILGNLVHIGAEYGKFNELRKKLGLPELLEAEKPQERFRIFEISSEGKTENDTIRFLFGNSEPFFYTAKYMGLEETLSSPVNQETRNRIRVVDFYLKTKEFLINKDKIFSEIKIDSKKFISLLEKINYFEHLKEEKEKVDNIINEIRKKEEGEKSLEEWIITWNEKNQDKKHLKIIKNIFIRKLLMFIFENYINGNFKEIEESLPDKISDIFFNPKIEIIKKDYENLFGGIKLPLELELDKEDIISIIALNKIVEDKFKKETLESLFPFKIN
ncbi:MAG: hypothetical protein KatS3mg094_529 [Candidatus Parcubacteria bacterium]|nr:MAG: hypothetical protein KatS3mg094_529 [Candidatus Parcubacteria bacterium]